ncbi:MAG: hypothetical protein K0R54_2105 [Clostridiaceae bacterium]|jgi:hypothetical protein|nr:hypothetical protein [Clostridiaceae bacterium]
MRFFEFDTVNFSYYALIGAKDEETAKQHYVNIVCDIFPDDNAQVKELPIEQAKERLLGFCKTDKQIEQINIEFSIISESKKPHLLIVEGGLF